VEQRAFTHVQADPRSHRLHSAFSVPDPAIADCIRAAHLLGVAGGAGGTTREGFNLVAGHPGVEVRGKDNADFVWIEIGSSEGR
jgi:hypothetical protein